MDRKTGNERLLRLLRQPDAVPLCSIVFQEKTARYMRFDASGRRKG